MYVNDLLLLLMMMMIKMMMFLLLGFNDCFQKNGSVVYFSITHLTTVVWHYWTLLRMMPANFLFNLNLNLADSLWFSSSICSGRELLRINDTGHMSFQPLTQQCQGTEENLKH